MKALIGLIWLATLTYSVWAYITPQDYSSQARTIGTLMDFKGDVFFRRPYQSVWQNVLKGSEFSSGTLISTGKGSEAKIEMEGMYTVHIPEDSQVSLDIQSGKKNELVLNILSGEIAVTKPKKADSSYLETISSRYSKIVSSDAPISVASSGATYALTQEVSKAQFKAQENGVSLLYSDGKITNVNKAEVIAATTVPILIAEEPAPDTATMIAKENQENLEREKEEEIQKKEELARSKELIQGQLATLKAKLVSKPYSFVRFSSNLEASKNGLILSFTGESFPSQYQYQLILSSNSKSEPFLKPVKITLKQLTYEVPRSLIHTRVKESRGDLRLNYQLVAVAQGDTGPHEDKLEDKLEDKNRAQNIEPITDVIDEGVIQFTEFNRISLPSSTLNLHYSPVALHDKEWHARLGQGTSAPLIAFEFSDSRLLPNILKNSFKNYVFNFSKPKASPEFGSLSPGTIFIKNQSPILVSSKFLDSEKVLDLKKDLEFDFVYSGLKQDYFSSGKVLPNTFSKDTLIQSLYFPESSLQVSIPKGFTSSQFVKFFRQLDQSFLINKRPIANHLASRTLSTGREGVLSTNAKRLTIIEYLNDGKSAMNPSKFEGLFFGFELTSPQIIRANFVANSLNMESITADPKASEKAARFILGLNQSDYVFVLRPQGQSQDLTIMWQQNAVLQKASFRGLKLPEISKVVEKFMGFDCVASSDGLGKAYLSFSKSTKSDRSMYIWQNSQNLDRLSAPFLAQETPVLAVCEQPLKSGCYARTIPQIAFQGVQKCSSFESLDGVPSVAH